MGTATNVDATAVNTIQWLSGGSTIVVPVYQRQYRWDIDGCEQLLADIRSVAAGDDHHTHFIGSILSTRSSSATGAPDGENELVLIDGQQRITTLMLLIAALQHSVVETDPDLAAELRAVLVRDNGSTTRTTLRPHRGWADVFESVVLGTRGADAEARDSRFDDNYAFFRSQVPANEVAHVWRGLRRLEHVAINLGIDANAQQTFESLNSTGAPLRDHELIHNYVLMGLSHAEQQHIETEFWEPIEANTGESIGDFWRHYLIATLGRELDVEGDRSVYDAFRHVFPRLEREELREQARVWREFSDVYRILLTPNEAPDAETARHIAHVGTFGRGSFPLVMTAFRDFARGTITHEAFLTELEHVQSLLLRRSIVGLPTDRIVARLCRARADGTESLERAVARISPSDDRTRVALKYGALPHAKYVLGRLAGVTGEDLAGLEVEHIVPLAPGDAWEGGDGRTWADYGDDEQNSHRALAPSLGNLTLLEEPLAMRALDQSYPAKRADIYPKSRVTLTSELAETSVWSTAAIAERTERLTAEFVRVWAKPTVVSIDDDGLTPILDAKLRRGWPRGWQKEFAYVEYRGEHWEVYDVKYLFNRIFKRLWADSRESVVSFSARRGGPIFGAQAWTGHWDALDENTFLYMGWDSKYMMSAVQGVLDEAGLAPEVFVKYSYIGDAM